MKSAWQHAAAARKRRPVFLNIFATEIAIESSERICCDAAVNKITTGDATGCDDE